MRQIKFRIWDELNQKMVFQSSSIKISFFNTLRGLPLADGLPVAECTDDKDFYLYDNMVVMQFTGLLDANGKEIYEGDILYSEIIKWHYVVEWLFGGHFLRSIEEPEYPKTMMIGIDELEVLGNIYENPELVQRREVKDEMPAFKAS